MVNMHNISEISLNSLEDGCKELGGILGLNEPVKLSILIGALRNEEYANNLLTCRNTPVLLQTLLNSPPEYDIDKLEDNKSTASLLMTASLSLAKWAKAHFTIAQKEVIARRRAACIKCPNIRSASGNAVYKAINSQAICSLCGCDIEIKTRFNSESCPSEDPQNLGYSRWGQEYKRKN